MSLDPNKTYLIWNGTKFPNSSYAQFKAPAGSTIDWGDGTVETFDTASTTVNTHTYTDGKTEHTIAISGLTSLGYRAFRECSNLMSVTIGNSVTSIGGGAFYYCSNLTSVTIPDSVTNIGYNTFQNCSNLTNVTIGNSVTSIGSYVFTSCSSLTSITIPDSVTSIDSYAFYNCSSLMSITIPNSVTSIGENAFKNCYKLIEVKNLSTLGITAGSSDYGYVGYYAKRVYTEGASYLSTDDNSYIIYNDSTDKILMGYTGTETNLTLPSGITQIYEHAFEYCSSLTSITIPDSVTSIGSFAFSGCSSLIQLILFPSTPPTLASGVIPANVQSIYVQQSSKAAYQAATNWTAFASKIVSDNIYLSFVRFNQKNKAYISEKVDEKVGNRLLAPTTPTADSVVTIAADGTTGTKALSEFGGKLYKHSIHIEFPTGEVMYISVTGLLPHNTKLNTPALLKENSSLLANMAYVDYTGVTSGGGGVFVGVQYAAELSAYMLVCRFGNDASSLNLTGFTSMTDTIIEL